MRLMRQIASIGFVTALALVYVHQHVELVKMSYAIQYNEKRLMRLLDRNERLGYTIKNLEDPSRLEAILQAKNIEFSMPKRGQVVQADLGDGGTRAVQQERVGLQSHSPLRVFEFLGLRAEAQAKEK